MLLPYLMLPSYGNAKQGLHRFLYPFADQLLTPPPKHGYCSHSTMSVLWRYSPTDCKISGNRGLLPHLDLSPKCLSEICSLTGFLLGAGCYIPMCLIKFSRNLRSAVTCRTYRAKVCLTSHWSHPSHLFKLIWASQTNRLRSYVSQSWYNLLIAIRSLGSSNGKTK